MTTPIEIPCIIRLDGHEWHIDDAWNVSDNRTGEWLLCLPRRITSIEEAADHIDIRLHF